VHDFPRNVGTPADVPIWDNKVVVSGGDAWGTYIALLCGGGVANGLCPGSSVETTNAPSNTPWNSAVTVSFKERISGVTIDLELLGHRRTKREVDGRIGYAALNETWPVNLLEFCAECAPRYKKYSGETSLSLRIPAAQLSRIPFGGLWEARLRMTLADLPGPPHFETAEYHSWSADIALRVTDQGRIYVENDRPIVMPFHPSDPLPFHGATIDACLYDGYGGNAPRYQLTLTDPASSGRAFALRHPEATASGASEEIEYAVWVSSAHSAQAQLGSGQRVSYENGDKAPMSLSLRKEAGGPCTPLRIALKVPPFDPMTKRAGEYEGVLRIEFTPHID